MKKWLPYLVAAVIGLGVAVLAFGPGMGGGSEKETPAKVEKGKKKNVNMGDAGYAVGQDEGDTKTPAEVVADAKNDPSPPPGTLRPMNKAEVEHAAKLERPFNKHFAYVMSFWNRAAQLVGPGGSDLSKECSAMARYLRDQGNLSDSELDVKAAIAKEQELVAKVRASGNNSQELTDVLDYIQESGQAVLDGKDPTTVLKPSQKRAAAGQ